MKRGIRSVRERLRPGALVLGMLGCSVVLLPAPAQAQSGGPASEKQADDAQEPGAKRVEQLEKRFADLEQQAAELAEDYKEALDQRIADLARGNPTLKRLREAGIFALEGELRAIPEDPLQALPWLRKRLSGIDARADTLAREFGHTHKTQNERVALSTLGKIARAQQTYREEDRDGNGILDYASDLKELARYRALNERQAVNGMTANGYTFTITHGDVLTYTAMAAPELLGESGDVFYFVDQSGVIRAERGKRAGPSSPAVEAQSD